MKYNIDHQTIQTKITKHNKRKSSRFALFPYYHGFLLFYLHLRLINTVVKEARVLPDQGPHLISIQD